MTDASLAVIGETCRGLTSIDIGGNENMTDIGIASLAKGCSQLMKINIATCSKLTDASLAAIGETCKGLTIIDMRYDRKMTNVGIASLTQGCSQLVTINIAGSCLKLTDASLDAIGKTCKGLTSIDIEGFRNFTDAGIASLTGGCRQLKRIYR